METLCSHGTFWLHLIGGRGRETETDSGLVEHSDVAAPKAQVFSDKPKQFEEAIMNTKSIKWNVAH